MIRISLKWIFIFIFFCLPQIAKAQGGPPLITDDPGTPGDGHWEINIASIGETSSSSNLFQVPYFDANYGWGDRIQLKFETGGAVFSGTQYSGTQTNIKTGWGGGLAGVKWRFAGDDDDDLFISTYPQYYFGYFLTSSDPDLGQPGNWALLPLEFAKYFGAFAVDMEVGYQFYWQGPNQIMGGIIFSYKLSKLELLTEFHENALSNGPGTNSLFNVGFRYDITNTTTLLFSAGHTLQTLVDVAPALLSYVGLQIRI